MFELLSLWHVKLCSCLCNGGSQVDMDDMDDMPHDDAMLEDFELERLHPLRYSPLTNAAASILFAPVALPPCSQMLLPPHSLHPLRGLCSQMLLPLHSLSAVACCCDAP